ncbi:FliH/SctL family protein [Naasia lichenicola]|uniref:Flagellar assembly protein FliH/Type III secretion system HrpE domain-containing protein n=1 Tax=Naasia lichenicola TaxID=2565933 RepID=A0A4S4FHA8_9MICO|nr:FliH/SctL family protein [Naasia lichenicola]THG29673.1 hypothetical protein E6C64_13470 [Naasia lichenicola]
MSTDFAPFAYPVLHDVELGEIAERARVQGHAAGYAAGRREATARIAAESAALHGEHDRILAAEIASVRGAIAALQHAGEQLAAHSATAIEVADTAVLAAAVELAEMIIGRELLDHEGSALDAVRRALAGAHDRPVRAVRMHPQDLELVADQVAADSDIRLVADPFLDRGDAIADVIDGIVDARISTAIDRARAVLSAVTE